MTRFLDPRSVNRIRRALTQDSVHIRIPYNQRTNRIPHPIAVRKLLRQRLERNQQWNYPYLAHQSYQEPLVDFLGDIGPELQLEDEEDG